MNEIIAVKGKVKYHITLDPSVWIFDDRKKDLETYFTKNRIEEDSLEEYTKSVSKHWDREIVEGAIHPPTLNTEKKFLKEKLLTGSFCIPLLPFLENAEPEIDAEKLLIITDEEKITLGLDVARNMIMGFSKDGKPLIEDGPVHLYYGDGSNQNKPITKVKELQVI